MDEKSALRERNLISPLSALLLDSSLITETLPKELYNIKLVNCNDYIQLYFQETKKINNKTKKDYEDLQLIKINNLNYNDNKKYKEIEIKNIIRSKLECQRLAKCNIKEWKTFITLTFADNVRDIGFANKRLHSFFVKIRRIFENFKYLCIPEFQKRGAVHYHLLTNIDLTNNNLIYKQEYNKKFFHIKYWNEGFTSVEELQNDKKKIIGYISKYMTKDIDNRLFGRRRYFYSQNLNKPKIEYLDIDNLRHKEYLGKILKSKELIYQNNYINPYNSENVLFQEFYN